MKKIVAIFLVLASVFSFAIAYNQANKEELAKMEKAEDGIARQFWIPNDLLLAGPDEMYPILRETANECRVNIFRTNIAYRADNRAEILKYVLLAGNTRFFDAFRLKSGRLLTAQDTQQGNFFMSTAISGDQNQVGVIRDFGGDHLITIKPLKASYEQFPVDGQYFVEISDSQAYDAFLRGFAAKVSEHYREYLKTPYTPEVFQKKPGNFGGTSETGIFGSSTGVLKYISYVIFVITLILLIYYVFNESRRIGIIKMHGVSDLRLWFILIGRLIAVIFILSAAASLFAAISIRDVTPQFVGSAVISQLKTYLIVTALSLVAYLYISRIRVSDALKNRRNTNGIFVLNTLLKAGCSVLLVLIGLSIWSQYAEMRNKQGSLKSWEHSKDYGVFYPESVGYDQDDIRKGGRVLGATIAGELYPVLNRMGAVLINAGAYEERQLLAAKDWDGIRSIKVNNNYLHEFPVYDIQNKPVQVSEETSDWLLLVPEKYRSKETEILSFFHKDRVGAKDYGGTFSYEEHFYKRAVPDSIRKQQIKIIWLANGQKIFSFNLDVFPTENNMIIDPIIQVVTEKNSVCVDRDSILGSGYRDPLKMRLLNRDTALTYRTLEPDLQRLKLDDNLKHLITVDQFVLQQIYNLQEWMGQLWLISLGLLAGLLILVLQNLIIFFNKYQRKFIVRRLFGTDFFRTYREYILLFSATWALQLAICCIVNRAADIKLFAAAAVLILIELAASVIALAIIEQRNRVKVLKGGI